MASFNQSERQPISPEDNQQAEGKSAMKLIADLGVAGKFRKRNGFWRRLCCCCCTRVSADEVINMSVPVKHLNKRLHIVVNCKSTKINLDVHPDDEAAGVEIVRDAELTRLKELLSMLRAGDRNSTSTRFSSPFVDIASVYCDAEGVSSSVDREQRVNVDRKRTKTL